MNPKVIYMYFNYILFALGKNPKVLNEQSLTLQKNQNNYLNVVSNHVIIFNILFIDKLLTHLLRILD